MSGDRKEWVRLSVQRPVLYAEDKAEIARKCGQGVKARIRKYEGQNGWEKRLCLKVPYDCNEKVVREATIRALGLIHANAIGLMMGPMPDYMDWTMPDMTTSCRPNGANTNGGAKTNGCNGHT